MAVLGQHVHVRIREVEAVERALGVEDLHAADSRLQDRPLDRRFPALEGKEGGVGLGLTLAHRVAEEHGGSVILVSSVPGETVFLLTFEKRPPGTPLSKISLERASPINATKV